MQREVKRFWEIDFLRGIAIILMIISNFIADLNFLKIYNINISSGFWWIFARITASIFIFLVGVCLVLSFQKQNKVQKNQNLFIKFLKRGLWIFSLGLIITLITYIFLKKGFVVFGILHFIGISIILAYFFIKFKYLNLLLGICFILTGYYLKNFSFDFSYLLWIGLRPHNFYTVDYFPLLPWFGIVLTGVFFGNKFYKGYKRRIKIPDLSNLFFAKIFCFLGRNSLLIYFMHQPVIILALHIFGITAFPLRI